MWLQTPHYWIPRLTKLEINDLEERYKVQLEEKLKKEEAGDGGLIVDPNEK